MFDNEKSKATNSDAGRATGAEGTLSGLLPTKSTNSREINLREVKS